MVSRVNADAEATRPVHSAATEVGRRHSDPIVLNCGSENDTRCQITRRKVSGGTRSDRGRDCRDTFLALAKTCAKLGIARPRSCMRYRTDFASLSLAHGLSESAVRQRVNRVAAREARRGVESAADEAAGTCPRASA
jgi:hypothetical protein